MKLTKVRITNFQSIQDSTEFNIGDTTCLVGKNESGKTALLKSLYRLNPINEVDGNFNVTDDYPRQTMIAYEDEVAGGHQEPAQVVQATYELEPVDIVDFNDTSEYIFKNETPIITLHKGYSNELELVYKNSSVKIGKLMHNSFTAEELINNGSNTGTGEFIPNGLNIETAVFLKHIVERIPKFFYFDEYYQMEGADNIDTLRQREANNTLKESDYPLLGLIHLAGLNLNQIDKPKRTEDLIARLEAASNSLTQKVLPYWSQNQHLEMEFDIRQGYSNDPSHMRSGMNILGRVRNTKHGVTTALGTRSRGFVWFFSFLAWYQDLRKRNENLILLLDEPGLFLHAKAQEDLLRYFEEELAPYHQLIYTTHSPFMVDPKHFDRVRIVQDLSIELDSDNLPNEQQGTKVITEVLEAIPDSLFPLQGALGYEIYQTLFIGPNSLVVEGVSDLLYIQTISALLQKQGKTGLNPDWTITPVGGSDKVATFVSLLGANTNLNLSVLIDYQKKDIQKIENLYKKKLLKKNQVLTYAEFVSNNEADIEDMFAPEFYLQLVNNEFEISLIVDDLPKGPPRIVHRLEDYFKNNPLSNDARFNHYRPALYFSKNLDSLEDDLTESDLDRFQKAFDVLNKLLVN